MLKRNSNYRSVFFRIYQKFTKDISKRNQMNILVIFCQNLNVAGIQYSTLSFGNDRKASKN